MRTTDASTTEESRRSSKKTRALVARLEKQLEEKLGRTDELAWDCGTLFDRIAKLGLHAEDGKTLEQYAQARFPAVGYSTLKRYRSVAVRFNRRSAKKHGMHKLWLGLEYIDLTPADERPAELLSMSIVLSDESKKPFAKCTAADLESAIARLKAAVGDDEEHGPSRLPRGAGARLKKIETELSRGLAADEPRPHVSHRVVKRDARATVLFTLHDVPIESTERVARALSRAAK